METTLDVARQLAQWAKSRQDNPSDIWGIPWGFRGLDTLTGGIQPEELTVLGARPRVGKSAWSGQVVLNVARWLKENRAGEVVRVVHREMTAREFQLRLACQVAHVSAKALKRGRVTEEQKTAFRSALKEIAELPIEIEAEPTSIDDTWKFVVGRTPESLKCAWWMVDYLQIHPVHPNSRETDPVKAASVLMPMFRDLSKRIPGMVLSQLTRAVDQRQQQATDKQPAGSRFPELSDLYGGTAVEANANVVILLHRPDLYVQTPADKRNDPKITHVIVAKNRSGDSGTVEMLFKPQFAEFRDISKIEED